MLCDDWLSDHEGFMVVPASGAYGLRHHRAKGKYLHFFKAIGAVYIIPVVWHNDIRSKSCDSLVL